MNQAYGLKRRKYDAEKKKKKKKKAEGNVRKSSF